MWLGGSKHSFREVRVEIVYANLKRGHRVDQVPLPSYLLTVMLPPAYIS